MRNALRFQVRRHIDTRDCSPCFKAPPTKYRTTLNSNSPSPKHLNETWQELGSRDISFDDPRISSWLKGNAVLLQEKKYLRK